MKKDERLDVHLRTNLSPDHALSAFGQKTIGEEEALYMRLNVRKKTKLGVFILDRYCHCRSHKYMVLNVPSFRVQEL